MYEIAIRETHNFDLDQLQDLFLSVVRIVVVAYDSEIGFYENCGFKRATDASPMFITDLWT